MPTSAPSAATERYNESLLHDRPPSVAALFVNRVAADPDVTAFIYPGADGSWSELTWLEADQIVRQWAAGLIALGVEPEDRVAIAAGTRVEWALADLANMCCGAATTTIYPTSISTDVAYIVANSGSRVVFAENEAQVAKLRAIREQIPDVVKVVLFDGEADGDWVIDSADLYALGGALLETQPEAVDARIAAIHPDHLATIIYTSGTTGRPKGVRLLHRTWTFQSANVDAIGLLSKDDVQYLWLPLAHVFGKQLLTFPLQIGFPTVIDGRVDKIVDNLAELHPTWMGAAPRIFEKAYGRISMTMADQAGPKGRLFQWGSGVLKEVARHRLANESLSPLLRIQGELADRLIGAAIRQRFGGKIRLFVSGSAALNQDVALWFYAMGMPILEGYGMTESASAAYLNRPEAVKIGTVGWPMPGVEAKLGDDGEVLLRGENVMDGYHDNDLATAEMIQDGWLHTGDIGEIDNHGYLRITDRKKDLFKTSNGKYVAPSVIEATFMGLCPYASQLAVYGADRNFVSALVTVDTDAIMAWAQDTPLRGQSYGQVVTSPAVKELIQGYIDELNLGLNRWEQIKKFTILDTEFSVDSGELTPSLKLKRKVVTEKYQDVLDAHYLR